MMRSLFSGVAGLKTHQTRMDVIGNNIANVNTVAYKSQSATFQELMYQNTQNASAANEATGRGGINAKQIGLGSSLAAINTNITQSGSSQSTGNAFDVQISGDSFFIVSDGAQNHFTRAGAFYVDGVGNLAMTSNGYNVMGWQPNEDGSDVLVDTVSPLKIMSAENLTSAPEQTTKAYLDGVIDKNDSNVTSSTGRLVNISVYDNLGYSYIVQLAIKQVTGGTPLKPVDGEYTITPVKLLNSDGKDLLNKDTNPTGNAAKITIGNLTDNKIVFDTQTGALKTPKINDDKEANFTITIEKDGTDSAGVDAFVNPISIDLANLKMYDNKGTSTVAGHYGDVQGRNAGRKKGALSGVAIQQDGKIYGSYDNGTSKLLGQIAVASFANASGLEKIGDNLYDTTQNSGEFDGIGKDITSDGAGAMKTGVLEMSNVDLSAEFTEMITTQRGFQANSRIITVSDTMLEELINLKR
ncbi:MAG: flagellar hook-basal body complex protein [Lachnospiraceae bacterium]|nr:flagellar hook-basal body complex protein [Lachnospiraceae bacterium]